ncbi:unnamed protein product [Calypogeia fissa]
MESEQSNESTSFESPHAASTAARTRHDANLQRQQEQEESDEFDTVLTNLETLLNIDHNFTRSKRKPPNDRKENNLHEENGAGRGIEGIEGDDTISSGPTLPANLPPKRHNYTKPRDPSLHHIRGTGVEFEDLWYTVVKKQKKDGVWIKREAHLLQGITGAASKGDVTAVMGPSGAGKSTLLDALAGRIASGSLGGTTKVDGRLVSPTLMKRMSAYVMQDDQLFPMLTVWETLWFAAEVRLHRGTSNEEKQHRVTRILDQLGLTKVRDTYIGDEKTRGISGGEKRRVSIGVDIIHGPELLFMDEPTSGLDSSSAYNVIEKVYNIATTGSTVILTIHQPSHRILRFFNRLLVLARGQLIYQGGPNYLSTHLDGFGRQVPRAENPIEYLLDVIQEFDKAADGVEPLVLYNHDGTKFNPGNDPEVATRGGSKTPVSAKTTRENKQFKFQSPLSDRSTISDNGFILSKIASPFRFRSKLSKMDDFTIEAMEVGGYGVYENMDDESYDHSINRAPRLASHYYTGLLESLADRFLTPRTSPGTETLPSPMQRRLHRTPSRTPLRSPSMAQVQQPQIEEDYETSLEPSPATFSKQASTDCTVSEKDYVRSSDYTVSEKDYVVPAQHNHQEKFANIWWREVVILIFRNVKNFQRSPEYFLSRQVTLIVLAFLLATMFLNVRHHLSDLDGVTSIMSFFILSVCIFFYSSNDAVPAFIMERLIFIRETSHNAYRASSYVIANAIVSLPFLAIQAMSYVLITWWALGLQHTGTDAFCFFFLILFVSLLCISSIIMLISSVVPNYVLAYLVVISFTSLSLLMCGYFVHREQIPKYWIWLHYLSVLKYPYESMMLNEFGNPKHQICYFRDRTGSCSLTGESLLQTLNITQLTKWESLVVLGGMAVFYRLLFYCVLRFGTKNQRS